MNAAREIFPDLSANKQQQMETDNDDNNDGEKEDTGSLDTLGSLKNLFMGKRWVFFSLKTFFIGDESQWVPVYPKTTRKL